MHAVRKWCLMLLAVSGGTAIAAEPWGALQQGGVVIMMRHATTNPGVGDPPGFRIDDCSSQRGLSDAGRRQAQRFGAQLVARGVQPVAVFSSAWCRCIDTAKLAFPGAPHQNLPALDSFFADSGREPAQTAALRAAIGRIPAKGVTVWVTHQVNITALTTQFVSMGEALVLKPDGAGGFSLLGRINVEAI